MKLITLAAGQGERVQKSTKKSDYLPKAITEVCGQTLIKWSVDSFHSLRVHGLIKQSDLIFVVQETDCEQFELDKYLYNEFGEKIGIIQLPKITRGPAETAFQAVQQLLLRGSTSLDETIIINDCDHYFPGGTLLRSAKELIESNSHLSQIFESEKDVNDLSWSFIQRKGDAIVGVVEKPDVENLNGINLSKGIIGVYGFSKIKTFLDLYENSKLEKRSKEFFISSLLNLACISGEVEIRSITIKGFIPLGTRKNIELAEQKLVSSKRLKESGTIFLDLDGTLFQHDAGYFSKAGNFDNQLLPLNLDNLTEINSHWENGTIIILTTARPESERNLILRNIAKLGLEFDHLLTGLNGGVRYLVNDSKDSLPGIQTSKSSFVARNNADLSKLFQSLHEDQQIVIEKEFFGESGERTLLLSMDGAKFIRKVSQANENSRQLIEYQSRWLMQIAEHFPNNVPAVSNLNSNKLDQYAFYDMQYIPNLKPLGKLLFESDVADSQLLIADLIEILIKMYRVYEIETQQNLEYLLDVMHSKALHGYKNALLKMGIFTDERFFRFRVNGSKVKNVFIGLEGLTKAPPRKLVDLLKDTKDVQTLIHGDPTLSNLVVDDKLKIQLLDPIGTRVLPNFRYLNSLGRTNPIFDFSRVRLSLADEYENWHAGINWNGSIENAEIEFKKDPRAGRLFEHFVAGLPSPFRNSDTLLGDLVHLTTLCRILPYKAITKPKEAIYMLSLIEKSFEEISSLFNA